MTAGGQVRVRLTIQQLELRLGIHRRTFAKWYRKGTFPRPHYIRGLRRWWLDEIQAWEVEEEAAPKARRRPAASAVDG